MGNVDVAWEDILSVLNLMKPHLMIAGIALLCFVVLSIAVRKKEKGKRLFIRIQSFCAFLLVAVIAVNVGLVGPVYNTLNVVLADKGALSQTSVEASEKIIEKTTDEGIILAKNSDGFLPIAPQKINVFGWASTNPIYGGTGSGTVDTTTAVGILQGLQNAGFETNQELSDLYTAYRSDRPLITINQGQDWTLPEPPAANYSESILNNAKAFSDKALIVISRTGGEGADLPHDMGAVIDGSNMNIGTKYMKNTYTDNSADYSDFEKGQSYLELSRTEKDLVALVCENFDDVIVVYNGANTLEMGWVEEYEQIRGVLLCAGAGATGFNSLGNIISGKVNPSGKTADTWVKDFSLAPYIHNIGHFAYDNVEEVSAAAKAHWERADGIVSFLNYTEGIYVGYKFFETAALEGAIDYDKAVMYPFGYGLSYTNFSQEMSELTLTEETIRFDVTVKNTGTTAGKDVVQVYYNPPYQDGGIEKSSVNLVAFDKTQLLSPGASETVTIEFPLEDMASYDDKESKHYVLEEGNYIISIQRDSHTPIDSKAFTLNRTKIYDESDTHRGDIDVATNRFDFARGEIEYLSRAGGFSNLAKVTAPPRSFSLPETETVEGHGTYDPTRYNNPADVMPVTGAKNGMELYDLRGSAYDDPRWESLLDQLTVKDMVDLIAFGAHQNAAVRSVGKIRILDTDGPAGVNSSTLGAFGTGYCSEVLLAQTWNVELAEEFAKTMGQEFRDFHVTGWYAPSMNMHRSAFGGRNFEYFSEDAVLSAKMGVAEVAGALESGMYPYIKHFAFNDQEINRNALCCTWITEQAIREIYLRPFEESVKSHPDGKVAIMSSYNYIGTDWAGGNPQLLKEVLRGEWGFRGMVLSDYFGNYGYMDADRAVRGGTDLMLGAAGNDAIMSDLSPTSVIAMRQAAKNIFYTTVNSSAYENYVPGKLPGWQITLYVIDGILLLLILLLEVKAFKSLKAVDKAVILE